MSGPALTELHLLIGADGALVAYQEKEKAWAGVLGFSTEERAREFCRASGLRNPEIATLDPHDRQSIAQLIREMKTRAIRFMLLNLDYSTGSCERVEFEGDNLGAPSEYQLTPPHSH